MALSPGTKLGPYEIQSLLGVGGMGEVACRAGLYMLLLLSKYLPEPGRMGHPQILTPNFAALSIPSKLVHKGEISSRYVSLVALLAHPMLGRVAVSELASIDVVLAKVAMLVPPSLRNNSGFGFSR